MEFHVTLSGAKPDPAAIENLLRAVDPAALVDIDASAGGLRVSASIDGDHLAALISQAGCPVAPQQVRQMPSVCCGGCSG